MKTYKDESGVVHAAYYHDRAFELWTWRSRCGSHDQINEADVYHVHRRPITCFSCMPYEILG